MVQFNFLYEGWRSEFARCEGGLLIGGLGICSCWLWARARSATRPSCSRSGRVGSASRRSLVCRDVISGFLGAPRALGLVMLSFLLPVRRVLALLILRRLARLARADRRGAESGLQESRSILRCDWALLGAPDDPLAVLEALVVSIVAPESISRTLSTSLANSCCSR